MISVMGVIFFIHFDHQIQPQGKNRHDPCLRLLARAFQNKSIYLVFLLAVASLDWEQNFIWFHGNPFFSIKCLLCKILEFFIAKAATENVAI